MKRKLLVIPSVPVWRIEEKLFFDRKFYDGFIAYCNNWDGAVQLVIRVAENNPPEFGLVLFDSDIFPAKLTTIPQDELVSEIHIKDADIVLASGDNFKDLHVSKVTQKLDIKCVYIIENILETRLQIIYISEVSNWQKLKSFTWTVLTEAKRRKAYRLANGLQANGTPAYNAYNKLVDNSLLYFDSRNDAEFNINQPELEARLRYLDSDRPLRLGFSGRLITMKGADHLIELGRILKSKQLKFTLDIFGAGELSKELLRKIQEYKLSDMVKLRGNVSFKDELIPFVKSQLDIFVCCHRQSDPSCTYLETYSCGVPIVGYANRAHQGILEQADVGWAVPMNNLNKLADKIIYLDSHREEIKSKSIRALEFSITHTFEKTFKRRIEQCKILVQSN